MISVHGIERQEKEREFVPNQTDLEQAFNSFNEISLRLADSYQLLQTQVCELQKELVVSYEEKNAVARDKQKISHRMERLLELLPGGLVVLDSSGCVEQCNPAAMALLGESLPGLKWAKVISENFSPRDDDGHEISLIDGRRLSIATRSLDDGRGQLVLLTDQTETRALQSKLARQNRLGTMGKMVAYLAHQIRTPLSAAMLYAGHLEEDVLPQKQRSEFTQKLLRQLHNLEQQVSDLLIFARGESVTGKRVNVDRLLQLLQHDIDASPMFDEMSIELHDQTLDVELACNPQSLVSAILNLINNALEAATADDEVMVNVTASISGERLKLVVSDNGPGVSKETLDQLLEPFFSTKSKGTGLGLAVVQAVVESLDGNLNLSSNKGEGLVVEMLLPCEKAKHNVKKHNVKKRNETKKISHVK
jgi:two-component system sensor histidine kinase FlrB